MLTGTTAGDLGLPRRLRRRHGYPPTVREIGEAVGLASPSTVHAHLANLERAGLLKRDPTKPRALELVGRERREPPRARSSDEGCRCSADRRRRAAARRAERRGLPRRARAARGARGLPPARQGRLDDQRRASSTATSSSCSAAQDARNGEIVVALAGDDESADEATVKRFFRENGRIRLQPENDALEPIYAAHVQILGKVTGVFRAL